MRKALFLFFCTIFCFLFYSCINFGCDTPYTIHNKTENDVTIITYSNKVLTVPANSSVDTIESFETGIKLQNPRLRLKVDVMYGNWPNGHTDCYITPLSYYNYIITNSTSLVVVVSEKNNMLGDIYGDTFTINPGESITVKVYTNNPKFKAVYENNGIETNFITYTRI